MLYRKIEKTIESHLKSGSDKIMIVQGARQVGKSFIIREVGKSLFPNYIEINLAEDNEGEQLFKNVRTVNDLYFQVSMLAGDKLGEKENTLIFLDEIQEYPQILTLLKFLRQDNRYTFIASGSLLGLALRKTVSVPVGSVHIVEMFPLDFEEFLLANGFNEMAVSVLRDKYENRESLDETTHVKVLDLFKKYLLVGGMPDAVVSYIKHTNINEIREIQRDIRSMYIEDAAKYESDSSRKLQIRRIYEMIPSIMENKKKRVKAKDIEKKKGARMDMYTEEFEYLISSGVAIDVHAISAPVFPLAETESKNLLKLYMNDVGLLTGVLYHNNIRAVLDHDTGVNLGAVYEMVVAQEFRAHGNKLFYYDNKQKGEVDYLVNDYDELSVVPVEVKSGRDYYIHSAMDKFTSNDDYHIKYGIVLSNEREIKHKGSITYMPVYYSMFIADKTLSESHKASVY